MLVVSKTGYVFDRDFGLRVSFFALFLKIGTAILLLICKIHLHNKVKSITFQVFCLFFHISFEWLSYFDIKYVQLHCSMSHSKLYITDSMFCSFGLFVSDFLSLLNIFLFILVCYLVLRSTVKVKAFPLTLTVVEEAGTWQVLQWDVREKFPVP